MPDRKAPLATVESPLADRMMAVMDAAFDPHWGEAWTHRQLTGSLVYPNVHARLVDRAGAPIHHGPAAGFTLVRAAPGEEELLLIAVLPEARGRGLGRKLLADAASAARGRAAERLFLEMRANNPAERLYRAAGFRRIGHRPEYYRLSDGGRIDAVTFALTLD